MNRNQKRLQEKENNKIERVFNKLSHKETLMIEESMKFEIKRRTMEGTKLIDKAMVSALLDIEYVDLKEVEEFRNKISWLIKEDDGFNERVKKERIDMVKLSLEIKDFMLQKMVDGKDKKKIIDSALVMFPTVSKTEISKNYIEVKKEFMKKAPDKEKVKLVEEVKSEAKAEVKKEIKVVEEVKPLKEEKVENKTSLEVIEEIKTIKLRGKNGGYIAQSGIGVTLEYVDYKLSFSSLEKLNEFVEEIKEVFSRI